MNSLLIRLAVVAAALIVTTAANAGELSIQGSTTVYSNVFRDHKPEIEKKSGASLSVIANGSGRGLLALVDGKADMAMISASLETTIAKINKNEPGRIDAPELVGHLIGETRIAFIVHPSNPVTKLNMDQVRDILLGKITNWSLVGGENEPIIVVSEDARGGIRALVEDEVLGKSPISAPGKKEVPNGTQVTKVISQISGAFGVSSVASVGGGAKTISTDREISQPLVLVTKGKASGEVKKVIAAARSILSGRQSGSVR